MSVSSSFAVLMLLLPGALQLSTTEEYYVTDSDNTTDYLYDFIDDDDSEKIEETQEQYQDASKLRVYKGPLPKFPGTTSSPWIALHSPIRMYIPIRNTGESSAESSDCIQCPKNLLVYLPPRQRQILTPIPTISICSSFAHRSGRVHVAVISGPRPGHRLSAGRYQVELMVWKAEGPVHSCKYTITVKGKRRVPTTRKVRCPKPDKPSNGILLCDPSGRKYYTHNSVCQIFCLNTHLIENSTTNSSTIVCKNGRWSPKASVSCVATFCPGLPQSPTHGSWSCDKENPNTDFLIDTLCKISCEPGYVILSSQLEKSTILCKPPAWNHSKVIPDCKRALLPKLLECHNRHLIIRTGRTVKISPQLLPKGTNHAGVDLTPVCSLQRKTLSKGKHQNICEVVDPELRTRRKCSYSIHIEESSGPEPHAGDCKNRTVFANRKGIIQSKPVRFLIKVGDPVRTHILHGNCKPKGELQIGTHLIVCKATDPDTKAIGTCSYWLKVQEKSCPPLRNISNGRVMCLTRTIGSICSYECNVGYIIPSKYLHRATKSCQSNLKWKPAWDPVCEIKPPELVEGCDNLEVELSASDYFNVPIPRYVTALNETLNASCKPSVINTAEHHQVWCSVDAERFNMSCQFNVTVFLENELTTISEISTERDEYQLVKGCEDLVVNISSPFNYTVPVPKFLTFLNETLDISCSPSFILLSGLYLVNCSAEDSSLDVSCQFNVTAILEEVTTTITFFQEVEQFELAKGCDDIEVNASSPVHFKVPLPQFVTAQNKTLNVSCIPYLITAAGQHQVMCSVDDTTFNHTCHFNVVIWMENQLTSVKSPEISSCKPLTSPLHSSMKCASEGLIETCKITCIPGYGFTEDNSLSVVCDGGRDGLWDFQTNINSTLPDCFAQMEGSAVEVWISFEAFAPHCEEGIEEQIKDLVNDICQIGTDCSKVIINCTLDEESDMMLMIVNWTVEADFNDEEYYEGEEIPEAEIRLESVIDRTRTFLAMEDAPGDLHLFRDSFRRGLITLVCPDGFIPNMLMAKCVQCSTGTENCFI